MEEDSVSQTKGIKRIESLLCMEERRANERARLLQAFGVPKDAALALNLNSARASKRTGRTCSICLSSTARFIAFESFSREPRFYGRCHLEIPRGTCGISVIAALRAKTCLNYASTIAISKEFIATAGVNV